MQKTYDICDKGEHLSKSIYTAKYRKIAGDKCKIPEESKSAFNFALIKEEKFLKCLEQQQESGLELNEDDDGFLDTDCVTVDTTTGECLSQSVFDDYILNVSYLNHIFGEGRFMDAKEYERMHSGSGSKWIIWVGLLLLRGCSDIDFFNRKQLSHLPTAFLLHR